VPASSQQRDSDARPARSKLARALRGAFAALLGLTFALVLAEALVRATDPYGISQYKDVNRYFNEAIRIASAPDGSVPADGRIFEHRPELALALRRFALHTDARGLRVGAGGRPSAAERAGAQAPLRILCLGDSVTLAWGVEDEHSWVRLLEREGRTPDGRRLHCDNGGHLQYNTLQQADLFAAKAAELEPHAVVLTFVSNDLEDAYATFLELQAAQARLQASGGFALRRALWLGRMREHFRGLRGLVHLAHELRNPLPAAHRNLTRVEDAPGYAQGWERVELGLERIRARCAERGIPLVVLDHGNPRVAQVRAWCAAHAVPWYDFVFDEAEWARDIRNSRADSHANALGNRILADKALAALAHAGWLAPAIGSSSASGSGSESSAPK
jgi:lysophospholipase L1-like esterase